MNRRWESEKHEGAKHELDVHMLGEGAPARGKDRRKTKEQKAPCQKEAPEGV